jgi:hypothetical protein
MRIQRIHIYNEIVSVLTILDVAWNYIYLYSIAWGQVDILQERIVQTYPTSARGWNARVGLWRS